MNELYIEYLSIYLYIYIYMHKSLSSSLLSPNIAKEKPAIFIEDNNEGNNNDDDYSIINMVNYF